MKKILLSLFIGITLISCNDKNGEVKKENLKNEVVDTKTKVITLRELKTDTEFKKILDEEILKAFQDRKVFDRVVDDIDSKINTKYDEFNKEYKYTLITEKKTDKIKVELFEKFPTDDDIINENSFYIRGNVTFNCVSNRYFSFDKILILTDKNKYEINANVFSQELKTENGKAFQSVKFAIDEEKHKLLLDIAYSDKAKIRFTKNDENRDFDITKEERERLRVLVDYIYISSFGREALKIYLKKR